MKNDLADNRVRKCFTKLGQSGRKALITFITAGDPNLATTADLVLAMERGGADAIELGVPFSDPVADGPVIQRASQRSLSQGTNLRGILRLVADLRQKTQIPLLLMSYYNPILHLGLSNFATMAAAAGVDGVIVPDLTLEEGEPLLHILTAAGLVLVPLAAPTSTKERLQRMDRIAGGFIYCVSLTGVTGEREGLPPHLAEFMQRARSCCRRPLAIGFGVSAADQAAKMAAYGDGVIVGSAIVRLVERYHDDGETLLTEVTSLVRSLKDGISSVRN